MTPGRDHPMPTLSYYRGEVTDPVTGETTTFRAATKHQLDQLIDEHLAAAFPDRPATDPTTEGPARKPEGDRDD